VQLHPEHPFLVGLEDSSELAQGRLVNGE